MISSPHCWLVSEPWSTVCTPGEGLCSKVQKGSGLELAVTKITVQLNVNTKLRRTLEKESLKTHCRIPKILTSDKENCVTVGSTESFVIISKNGSKMSPENSIDRCIIQQVLTWIS